MTNASTTKFLDVPAGKIAYDDHGKGQPPVVLIHEAIADRRMWDRDVARLSKTHRVVRYDMRGFGESPPTTGPFSAIDDLSSVILQLGLERPVIVGASMGGRVALDFQVAHPGVARGLLLVAPGFSGMDFPMFPPGVFDVDEKASQAASESFKAGKVEEAIDHLVGLWGAAQKGKDLERFREMARKNAKEIFLETSSQQERRVDPKAATRLSTLDVPLRVLVGDRDNPAMPHVARYLAEHIPRARWTLVPGGDHMLNVSQPGAFAKELDDFLAELSK